MKPLKPQDKLFKSFIDHCKTYKIPERKYESMDKTVYQVKGTHKFYKWESENFN